MCLYLTDSDYYCYYNRVCMFVCVLQNSVQFKSKTINLGVFTFGSSGAPSLFTGDSNDPAQGSETGVLRQI